jgi:hypothetical protein
MAEVFNQLDQDMKDLQIGDLARIDFIKMCYLQIICANLFWVLRHTDTV